MLIGQDVQRTGRVLQVVASALDRASFPAIVDWFSRKQRSVALSSAENIQ
jgi:O-antigen/teichoic acid export membrane protein